MTQDRALKPLAQVRDPDRLRDLLDAVLAIGSDLSLPHVLQRIVEVAVQIIGARYGALGVLSEGGGRLSEFVYVGIDPGQVTAIGQLPTGRGILGLLTVDPRPVRLRDLSTHPGSVGFPSNHPAMSSFLGVPILVRGEVFGNLYLTEKKAAPEFSDEDEGLAVALAGAAGIAIDNARLHARVRDYSLVEDRERIAADLHDTVIQRLFATGLALQATVKVVEPPRAAQRVEAAVHDLDETIRQIRSTIFALQTPRVAGRGVRAEILTLTSEAARNLGFEPHLRFDGPIDSLVDDVTASHLLAVLREALSNVVRHADATRVDICVAATGDVLTGEVHDDGVGFTAPRRPGGQGLANLAQRAAALGGSLSTVAGPNETGTLLTWRVPLDASGVTPPLS